MRDRFLTNGLRLLALLAPPLALGACGSPGGGAVASANASAPAARASLRQPLPAMARDPQFRMEPGLEEVIGSTEGQLVARFGPARLEVWEDDAKKLQFTGAPCILDVYLYPTSRSREPLATYADARRSDGQDVDKAACVRALKR